MQPSLPSLASALLSASTDWFASGLGDGPIEATGNMVTPRDPPTLTLALVGLATVAIYLVARWRPSRSGAGTRVGGSIEPAVRRDAVAKVEQERQSRGAA